MDLTIGEDFNPLYEEFVRDHEAADLCHLPGWTRMIQNIFGHRGYYLVARDGLEVRGVLPLSHIRSRIFGNRLVSQPFSDYGGILAADQQALDLLYRGAVELATCCECQGIEFRNIHPMPYELASRTDKACMLLPLAPDPDQVWTDLRPQIRNRIRKAQSTGLTVSCGGHESLEDFYRIWTTRMRQLGTPCYPKRLFQGILDTFGKETTIFLARYCGRPIGGIFAYVFNGTAHTRWGATLRQYDQQNPNYLLNWSAIEYYCKVGAHTFDFGRSTIGSSQYVFKHRWGARPLNLNWQYWLPRGRQLRLISPDAPAYRWKTAVWKRLPLTVTRIAGPWLSVGLV